MAFIARFIGVNHYKEQNIRDLTGAGNDATALWALFTDSISGIDSDLIIGANATASNIKKALNECLVNATEKDVVIMFYSGHGTHDHRITGFDTNYSNYDDSTIRMREIADLFKKSQAKLILCILDCCFSGGTPAKVLDDSPISRDVADSFENLAGEGRIIIAASNHDEMSYELPTTGHGILTKAIIDLIQNSQKNINILDIFGRLMEIVRSEASKVRVRQTPVIFNHVTGGFILPRLTPGERFFKAFPQSQGIKITRDIEELKKFGFPEKLLSEWRKLYSNGLNELQLEAINEYRILDGNSLLTIAPTSSGKTFVGELAGAKLINENKKCVFLFPYKALVNEKYNQFIDLYKERLGYRVIRCTGDYLDENIEFIKAKYDIALFTYEMFLSLSVSFPNVLRQIGLVVLDEAQFITDSTRGISVELILTNLITARKEGIHPQLIVLSAVIGGSNYFEDWLHCKKLLTQKRPVPLIEGVMNRSGNFQYIDTNGKAHQEQLLPSYAIQQRRSKPSQQDMIVPLVKHLLDSNEKVIVFRNQRGSTEGCANYLAKDLSLEPASDEINFLPQYNASTTSTKLKECFLGGVAFHDSNLSREERSVVEKVFRDPSSKIRVLVATTTVAAGINTPASTVILAEQEFIGEDGRKFTTAEYKNMAGRAGRVGFNEKGKAIILASNAQETNSLFDRYVLGKPEDLKSSFDINKLETWIIRLLVQVKNVKKDELINLLANTYGGYVANRENPDWDNQMRYTIGELYKKMLELEIIEEEGEFVHLTLLGRTCGESVLSFKSAMRLIELLKIYQQTTLTPETLMALVQALPELDDAYTPMNKKGVFERRQLAEAAQRYSDELVFCLQKYTGGDEYLYYARCKRASILFDWLSGVSTPDIELRFKSNNPFSGNITYGDIRRFVDLTRFILKSSHKIIMLIFPSTKMDETAMDDLLKSLEVGIPSSCLDLLEMPFQMSREEYLNLISNNINTKECLLKTSKETLSSLLEVSSQKQIDSLSENT